MLEDMRMRNFSPHTQRVYVSRVAAFARFHHKAPELLGPEDVRRFQIHLIDQGLSYKTLALSVCALRFLYHVTLGRSAFLAEIPYPRKERHLPDVLSAEETWRFLLAIEKLEYRVALTTAYAAGLRVSEVTALEPSDIDSHRMLIHVRQGKGKKDRFVMLSERLLEMLRAYWKSERIGKVHSPWLFPAASDPLSAVPARTLRKACKAATHKADIDKRISVHSLRHAFATHLLEAGTPMHAIQTLLGHKAIGTTSRYVHLSARFIHETKSPLDLLDIVPPARPAAR
jgi:site-specific recombinase XerD